MFADRRHAGRELARRLLPLAADDPVVLGLPRGGVVVAAEVARALDAPLDVLVVRKIGAPGQPELALGAVIDGNPPQRVLNERLVRALGVDEEFLAAETARQASEARRRLRSYRADRPPLAIAGRTVIVVDDGVATGATTTIALRALRSLGPRHVVLAVPVGAPDSIEGLRSEADEVVCLYAPAHFRAVGECYGSFEQTTDEEVVEALAAASVH